MASETPCQSPAASAKEETTVPEKQKLCFHLDVLPDLHLDLRPLKTNTAAQGSKICPLAQQDSISLPIADVTSDPLDDGEDCKNQECATPKSKEHRLPETTVCPPAPRKRGTKRKRQPPASERFFVPSDLHTLPPYIKALFR